MKRLVYFFLFLCYLCTDVVAQSVHNTEAFLNNINSFEFGLIEDIEAHEDGKVYVLDGFLGILLFNEKGELITENNSKGEGPGDFNTVTDILHTKKGLLMLDQVLFRVTLLHDSTLKYVDSYQLPLINTKDGDNLSPKRLWEVKEGYVIEYSQSYSKKSMGTDRKRVYALTDGTFDIINDVLFKTRDTEMLVLESGEEFVVSMHPFAKDELIEISKDGDVYTFWTGANCMNLLNQGTEARKEKCYSSIQQAEILEETFTKLWESEDGDLFRNITMPEYYPFAEEMVGDSGENAAIWLTKREGEILTSLYKINKADQKIADTIAINQPFKLLHANHGVLYGTNRITPVSGYQKPVFMTYETNKGVE